MNKRVTEYLVTISGSVVAGYLTAEILSSLGRSITLPLTFILVTLGLQRLQGTYVEILLLLAEIGALVYWAAKYRPEILSKKVEEKQAPAQVEEKPLLEKFKVQEAKPEKKIIPTDSGAYMFVDVFQLDRELPNVFSGIVKDEQTGSYKYVVVEPPLTSYEKKIFKEIRKLLIDELDIDLRSLRDRKTQSKYLENKVKAIVSRYGYKIPKPSLEKLLYYYTRDFIGLGKIEPLMHDYLIEDISCDGPKVPVYVWHRDYESIPTNIIFEDDEELNSFVSKLAYVAGKHISLANPIVDASLPDGSRVQLTYGKEITQKGSTFTIRKFKPDPLTIVDLLKYNTMSSEVAAYLWYLVEKRLSILVAGGTASGKTTTLNAISMFIVPGQKIVSVEDTPELNLPHENWIQSVARLATGAGEVTLFDLLRAALRQRPDIIIVGEVRGQEAFTLFQAIATGHGGLGTIHADSVETVITRLTSEPMKIPKSLLGSTLDCIVMQLKVRLGEKSVRRTVNVTEVVGYDSRTDQIILNDAYRWDPVNDRFAFSGRSRLFEKITERYGVSLEQIRREIEGRKVFLEWLVAKNIRSQKEVSKKIREFYSDPESMIGTARLELEARSS